MITLPSGFHPMAITKHAPQHRDEHTSVLFTPGAESDAGGGHTGTLTVTDSYCIVQVPCSHDASDVACLIPATFVEAVMKCAGKSRVALISTAKPASDTDVVRVTGMVLNGDGAPAETESPAMYGEKQALSWATNVHKIIVTGQERVSKKRHAPGSPAFDAVLLSRMLDTVAWKTERPFVQLVTDGPEAPITVQFYTKGEKKLYQAQSGADSAGSVNVPDTGVIGVLMPIRL